MHSEEHSVCFKMMPITSVLFKLQRFQIVTPHPLPSTSLTLSEKWNEGINFKKFKHLEIKFKVTQDDPRLKALNIYTQFCGIQTILIKHAPRTIFPGGMKFYEVEGDYWDNKEDRVLEEGSTEIETIIHPVDFVVASGLFAQSLIHKGSQNGTIKIGMVKGSEDHTKTIAYDSKDFIVIVPLGTQGSSSSGFALDSNNPICKRTFIFTDFHPIPFAIYGVWGYFNDNLGGNFANVPVGLAFAIYQPEHLRVGKIVKRIASFGGKSPFAYTVRYPTSLHPISFDTLETEKHLLKYEIGRWVLVQKDQENRWYIIPSSIHYWKDVVDFFRNFPGL